MFFNIKKDDDSEKYIVSLNVQVEDEYKFLLIFSNEIMAKLWVKGVVAGEIKTPTDASIEGSEKANSQYKDVSDKYIFLKPTRVFEFVGVI